MNPDQVRQIIHEELESLLKSDRYTIARLMQFLDGRNIQLGTSVGTKFGTGTTELLAFYNSTPVVQRTGSAQNAVSTTGATQTTPFGYTTAAQANDIVTLVNELRAALVALGLIKGSS